MKPNALWFQKRKLEFRNSLIFRRVSPPRKCGRCRSSRRSWYVGGGGDMGLRRGVNWGLRGSPVAEVPYE
jgi:hypothetical protein